MENTIVILKEMLLKFEKEQIQSIIEKIKFFNYDDGYLYIKIIEDFNDDLLKKFINDYPNSFKSNKTFNLNEKIEYLLTKNNKFKSLKTYLNNNNFKITDYSFKQAFEDDNYNNNKSEQILKNLDFFENLNLYLEKDYHSEQYIKFINQLIIYYKLLGSVTIGNKDIVQEQIELFNKNINDLDFHKFKKYSLSNINFYCLEKKLDLIDFNLAQDFLKNIINICHYEPFNSNLNYTFEFLKILDKYNLKKEKENFLDIVMYKFKPGFTHMRPTDKFVGQVNYNYRGTNLISGKEVLYLIDILDIKNFADFEERFKFFNIVRRSFLEATSENFDLNTLNFNTEEKIKFIEKIKLNLTHEKDLIILEKELLNLNMLNYNINKEHKTNKI